MPRRALKLGEHSEIRLTVDERRIWTARTRLGSPYGPPVQRQASATSQWEAEQLLTAALASEIGRWEAKGGIARVSMRTVVLRYLEVARAGVDELLSDVLAMDLMLTPTTGVDRTFFEAVEAELRQRSVEAGDILLELRRMTSWGMANGYLAGDVLAGYRPLRIRAGQHGAGLLTCSEVLEMVARYERRVTRRGPVPSPVFREVLHLVSVSGLTIREVLALEPSAVADVEEADNVRVRVHRDGYLQWIQLNEEASELVRARRELMSSPLFMDGQRGVVLSRIRQRVANALAWCGQGMERLPRAFNQLLK